MVTSSMRAAAGTAGTAVAVVGAAAAVYASVFRFNIFYGCRITFLAKCRGGRCQSIETTATRKEKNNKKKSETKKKMSEAVNEIGRYLQHKLK